MVGGQQCVPLGFFATTIATTAPFSFASVTQAAAANLMLIVAEGGPMRWRDDGQTVTVSSGLIMQTGAVPFEYTGEPRTFQCVAVSASVTVSAACYAIRG
jgi:hypothetical protein